MQRTRCRRRPGMEGFGGDEEGVGVARAVEAFGLTSRDERPPIGGEAE